MLTMGECLRKHRKKAGLTQKEVAAWVGVSIITIRNWEKDIVNAPIMPLWILADFYGVTMDELVGRDQKEEGK